VAPGVVLRMANPEATRGILRDKGGDVNLDFQFFDEAVVMARGGSGGNGAATFKNIAKGQRGPPNGGSGGKGGDVILECVDWLNTLGDLRGSASFAAQRGVDGEARFKNGAEAPPTIIPVPPGTVVRCEETGAQLGELARPGQKLVVAKGGLGGRGNAASKGGRGTAPRATPPSAGQRTRVKLELKLVADVGFVGVPNAGKSTLLAAASNAKPKICDYPFTTLVPNLGVCEPSSLGFDGPGMVLADIPGLLEGAHKGVGLGLAFLRHVERCRLIVHVVSGASPDPIGDFVAINQELSLFSESLAEKPQVVILNKVDLPEVAEKKNELMLALRQACNHNRIMEISAAQGGGVPELMRRTRQLLTSLEKEDARIQAEAEAEAEESRTKSGEDGMDDDAEYRSRVSPLLSGEEGGWRVSDVRLQKLAGEMDFGYYDAEKVMSAQSNLTSFNSFIKPRTSLSSPSATASLHGGSRYPTRAVRCRGKVRGCRVDWGNEACARCENPSRAMNQKQLRAVPITL
jgi:GTP-binding protein